MRRWFVALAVALLVMEPVTAFAQLPIEPVETVEGTVQEVDKAVEGVVDLLPEPIKSPVENTKGTVDKTVRDVLDSPKPVTPDPELSPVPTKEPKPQESPGEAPREPEQAPAEEPAERQEREQPRQREATPQSGFSSNPPGTGTFSVPEVPRVAFPRIAPVRPPTNRGGPGFTILEPDNPYDWRLTLLGAIAGFIVMVIAIVAGRIKADHQDRLELTEILKEARKPI